MYGALYIERERKYRKLAANVTELGHCNHLAMTWASWSLDPEDH